MYTPWQFMVAWLDGTLKGAPDGYNTVVIHSNLLAQGAIIAPGRKFVKAQGAPANWFEV